MRINVTAFSGRRFLASALLMLVAAEASAQSSRDTAAARAIALTPASTFVVMNPAMLGNRVRGELDYTYAHKPFWRTSGIGLNVGNFRIQAGRGAFAFPPKEDEYFVGLDYAGTLLEKELFPHLAFVVGADASLGYGAEKFRAGFGYVAETTGGFISTALRAEAGPVTIIPYFAPGFFRARYTRVTEDVLTGKTGKRITQGGGVRIQFFDHLSAEFGVRKTRIGEAVPRYGMSIGASALPLPQGVPSNVTNVRIEMDNDYFAFRTPPQRRPDEDYTNGLRLSFDRTEPIDALAFLTRHAAPCAADARVKRCSRARLELGQEIYTPVDDSFLNRQFDRRYAGWLYGSYSGHLLTDREDRSVTIAAGVVGPQSLAKTVQTGFHALFPWYHHPNGWADQLAFEPGVIASSTRRYIVGGTRYSDYLQLIPEWRVSAGNVLTGASVKTTARIGYNVPAPWSVVTSRAKTFGAYAFAGAREDLVLHNIFLDGNTSRHNSPVKRVPWVWQQETGFGFKAGFFTAEYRLARREREYRVARVPEFDIAVSNQPVPAGVPIVPIIDVPSSHPFGTLSVTIDRSF